jgi:TM2 domain-containing membrane protein YozV
VLAVFSKYLILDNINLKIKNMKVVKILMFSLGMMLLGNNAFAAIPISPQSEEVVVLSPQNVDNSNLEDAEGKSQLIALILCILIGTIGIHRFYLGYIGIGLIQLFTLGGFGIWTLIDLIMIITGDLKPKNGEYEDTL